MTVRAPSRTFIDDLPVALTIDDLRRAAGGRRRLASARHFTLMLAGGAELVLELVRRPGRFGGVVTLMQCPTCGRACSVLRHVSWGQRLACFHCLQVIFGTKYRSQVLCAAVQNLPITQTREV